MRLKDRKSVVRCVWTILDGKLAVFDDKRDRGILGIGTYAH
jgi:hypothetical protein